jgi:hypothetical protein
MSANERPVWSSDTRISMPEPADEDSLVPMFGFAMTQYRLTHDISRSEMEELYRPSYAPHLPSADVSSDDVGVNRTGQA